jgi:hypothetical protein
VTDGPLVPVPRDPPDPRLAHLAVAIADGRVRVGSPGDGEAYVEEDDC